MKWIDSRLKTPSTNHFDGYVVAFLNCDIVFVGLADWMPTKNYTDGQWQNVRCTNGNAIGGKVLYWMEHPNAPNIR